MLNKLSAAFACALGLGLAGCGGGSGAAVHIATPVQTTSQSLTAFKTQWGMELSPAQVCSSDISAATSTHASVIRVQYLPALQPRTCYDGIYATAKHAGLKVLWITPAVDLNAPVDPASYARIMAAAARSYPGSTWELMNEPDLHQPDISDYWNDEALAERQYLSIATAAAPAIHAADRTAVVISGGPSGFESNNPSLPWLHATLPLAPLVDGVSFHPYSGVNLQQIHAIGQLWNKPVYITEWSTDNGGIIEAYLAAYNGVVPLFNYCGQACNRTAVPIFP
ncbi:MAG: hypothetical protein ABSB70_20630 [Candidatus Velthaea sp.]|jgi:hypothetical protein